MLSRQSCAHDWMEMMNRSTIYRRHEARRTKTLALRDDPRSAPERVMSCLPFLSILFPPYQPKHRLMDGEHDEPKQRQPEPLAVAVPVADLKGMFNVTSTTTETCLVGSTHDDNTIQTQYGMESNSCPTESHQNLPDLNLKAVAVSGFSAAMLSQLAVGNTTVKRKPPSSSILSSAKLHGSRHNHRLKKRIMRSLHLQTNAGATASEASVRVLPHLAESTIPWMNMASKASTSPLFVYALSNSCLFTTKVFVERRLLNGTRELEEEMGRCTWLASASTLASAAAGGVIAIFRTFFMGIRVPIAREMMSTTAYFSVYETIKSVLSQRKNSPFDDSLEKHRTAVSSSAAMVENPKPNLVAVGIAGGLAGAAYESLRVVSIQQHSMLNTHFSMFLTLIKFERLYWMFLRAVPANALLFLGYEVTICAFSKKDSS